MSEIELESDGLRARVDTVGAELTSLDSQAGRQLLWPGNPDTWPAHAPTLFPVIGPLEGGLLRHEGREYPMPAHGFAQMSNFEVAEHSASRAVLAISDSPATREQYPFAFRFSVSFQLSGNSLACVQSVENRSQETLPADLGFHPGFRWPLQPAEEKDGHIILFEDHEPEPIRRGVGDPIFLLPESLPTPVRGNLLQLDDALFEAGPLVFDKPRSRSLSFGTPGGLGLRLDFPDSPNLALWMLPGEAFLAIEPWHGLPSLVAYKGPFAQKPGVALVPPGASLQHRLTVTTVEMNP